MTVIHLRPPVARRLVRPTRELRRRAGVPASRDALSYLALLRVELARFTPAPGCPAAGSSLWRWSSPRGGRALPATLRRGARTFLTPPVARRRATVRSPRWPADSTAPRGKRPGTADRRARGGPPRPRRTFLIHLDHELRHAALAARLPAGVEIAVDGLELRVPR